MRRRSTILFLAALSLTAFSAHATTWHINPGGTGDAPTIQAGVDSAAIQDTVLVAPGTYTGIGNRDIDLTDRRVILRSEQGPDATIIDCERLGRGFFFQSAQMPDLRIEGFTITNGLADLGGAFKIFNTSASGVTISNCRIVGNEATSAGGGIWLANSDPIFENCEILMNTARTGGGIEIQTPTANDNPEFHNCVIAGNSSLWGGGLSIEDGYTKLTNCIITGNRADSTDCCGWGAGGGLAFGVNGGAFLKSCTIAGNYSGWLGGGIYLGGVVCKIDCLVNVRLESCIVDQNCAAIAGNELYAQEFFFLQLECTLIDTSDVGTLSPPHYWIGAMYSDPLFCDPEDCNASPTLLGDYFVDAASPAVVGSCGAIGAFGVGCNVVTSVASSEPPLPTRMIRQIAPNPFNPALSIHYETPQAGLVNLAIYDPTGRFVATLVNRWADAGSYSTTWYGHADLGLAAASGTYFLRLEAGGQVETRKITLVR